MKVSIPWLRQLVDLKVSIPELVNLINLKTIGTKQVTADFIELDMKGYNRADLLSMRGVALEVAALTGSKVNFSLDYPQIDQKTYPSLNVTVSDQAACPIYCLARIEGLRVEKSNPETVKKLTNCGLRSVNNLVDITNLLMLEYGQPLHSFDADKVTDKTVIVRKTRTDETVLTLDGKLRELLPEDLLITDPAAVLGIAGIMGSKDSEISGSTQTILLEAAIFDPVLIRKTSSRLDLPSEAAKRFQHGLTKQALMQAFAQAISCYQKLGGKITGLKIIDNLPNNQVSIDVNLAKVNRLVGIEIPPQNIIELLNKLHFRVEEMGKEKLVAHVPFWRLDVNIAEDLIEEIARMYSYEKISAKPLEGRLPAKISQKTFAGIASLKSALSKTGLTEVQTYSFYSTQVLNHFGFDRQKLIKIANPISAETEYLKDQLWPNLIEAVAKNLRQGFSDIAIFEIGTVFISQPKGKPKEEKKLAIALTNQSDNPISELYQIYRKLLDKYCEAEQSDRGVQKVKKHLQIFHPNRFLMLKNEQSYTGIIAEVHQRLTDTFGMGQRVAILELAI